MILGIDVSTSITGFAVVGDGQLLHHSMIDLRKHKGVFAKAGALREHITDFFENYQLDQDHDGWGKSKFPIEHIYIEQPFTFFNSGGSSAKTMAILQRFNDIVSWLVYELFEIEPEYILATQARKTAGIRVPRGQKAKEVVLKYILATQARKTAGIRVPRGQKAKEVVLKHLLDTEPAFHIEYTKHGNPVAGSYDKADAIVVAKAGYIVEQQKEDTIAPI